MNNEPVAWLLQTETAHQFTFKEPTIVPQNVFPIPLYTHSVKTLTNEEILCLWDWWSGEILSTDILDFADTYKRALLGEKGLVEWHQEYVKKMNKEHDLGIAEAIGFDKGYKAATVKTLTDEEIMAEWDYEFGVEVDLIDFARAILKKASEK
jgi:hypothetical protein